MKTSYAVLEGEISQLITEDMHAQYLESAEAAGYEGDPVDGFVMQVAGKTVKGSFWKTTFQNGDHVQVVGRKDAGVFRAVAVTKPDERVIWMLPHCVRGTKRQKRKLLRNSALAVAVFVAGGTIFAVLKGWPLDIALMTFFSSAALILYVTVGMSWSDFMSFAEEIDAVAEALKLPEPEKVDLPESTRLAVKNGRPDLPMGVFYY